MTSNHVEVNSKPRAANPAPPQALKTPQTSTPSPQDMLTAILRGDFGEEARKAALALTLGASSSSMSKSVSSTSSSSSNKLGASSTVAAAAPLTPASKGGASKAASAAPRAAAAKGGSAAVPSSSGPDADCDQCTESIANLADVGVIQFQDAHNRQRTFCGQACYDASLAMDAADDDDDEDFEEDDEEPENNGAEAHVADGASEVADAALLMCFARVGFWGNE